jgi:hypothetical protein
VKKKEHYQRMAAECLRIAHNAQDPNNKAVLVDMAATWTRLAEQAPPDEIGARYPESDDE